MSSQEEEQDLEIPDDALTEILETCPTLSEQQSRYIYWRITGHNAVTAFRRAGYSGSNWRQVETRPAMREALGKMLEKVETEHRVTKNTIVGVILEGIEVARRKDQAHNLILGGRTLAEIYGVMAEQKINITQQSQIDVNHTHEVKLMASLDRSQLERLLDLERVLPTTKQLEYIDAEYQEVKD
jgi:hypothetical protein